MTRQRFRLAVVVVAAVLAVTVVVLVLGGRSRPADTGRQQVEDCFYAHNRAGDTAQDVWDELDGSLHGATGCVQVLPSSPVARCVHGALSPALWARVAGSSDASGLTLVGGAVNPCFR